MNDKIKMIINIVGFYIGWWGCILGSSNGLPYIGPLLMLLFIIFHGAFFVKNYRELQFIIVIGIIGTIVDSGLVLSKFFTTYPFLSLLSPAKSNSLVIPNL